MAPTQPSVTRYTFGDDDAAARRLGLVSGVLAAPSAALLEAGMPTRPRLALDLRCGPGFSTALVAATTGADVTVGLDRSPAFVHTARRCFPALRFTCHDVTTMPFPTAPPDLVFARLVLAHLPDPAAQVRRWARGLAPGGRLVLEEMEWIDAPDPVLAAYEARVLAVVANQGAPMFAGPLLDEVRDHDGVRLHGTEVQAWSVPTAVAARIYALNLEGWRRDAYAVTHFGPAQLDRLAAGLEQLAADGTGHIAWGLRHVVLARDG